MDSHSIPCRGCCLHDARGTADDHLSKSLWSENISSPPEVDGTQRSLSLFREMPTASFTERTGLGLAANPCPPSVLLAARRSRHRIKFTHCVFCKNNGEAEELFTSHTVKDDFDRVTCPVLSAYKCPICNATGAGAHTLKYCPKNKERNFYEQLLPMLQQQQPQPRRVLAFETRPLLRAPGGPVYADGGYFTAEETPPPTPFGNQDLDAKNDFLFGPPDTPTRQVAMFPHVHGGAQI